MFSFLKKNTPAVDGTEVYEEIGEKRTTLAGSILLILMAILLIVAGETVFNDLQRIPEPVSPPSYAVSRVVGANNYLGNYNYDYQYDYGYDSGVTEFNDIDREFNLDALYSEIEPTIKEIAKIDSQIGDLKSQISQNEYQIQDEERQYNLGLQEKIANEQVLYNKTNIQSAIISLRNTNTELENQVALLESSKIDKRESISGNIDELRIQYGKAESAYRYKLAVYKFKIFLLQLIFVLPFFIVSTRYYFRLKKTNSPYTIIATSIMGASAILFLQIALVFLYDVIPHEWFVLLYELFTTIPLFRYILYYGSVALVIAVFGGLVFLIQKRMFNSRIVAIRRLKNNKCPKCEFSINNQDDFCPKCGVALKEKCLACGDKRICSLDFCPKCGKRQIAEQPKI